MKLPQSIDESIVSNDLAILAKAKSFNEMCYTSYPIFNEEKKNKIELKRTIRAYKNSEHTHFVSAPTQSHLKKWLRDVHNIIIQIEIGYSFKIFHSEKLMSVDYLLFNENMEVKNSNIYVTYEEALEAALIIGLMLLNNKIK